VTAGPGLFDPSPFDPAVLCPLTTDAALRRAVALAPGVEAIIGPDGRLTYGELGAEVARIRAGLNGLGVQHGEHVGICLGNGWRFMALFLAVGSMGAVAVPVNTRLRADEIAYALRQSRVRTLVVADRLLRTDFVTLLRGICPAIDGMLPDPAFPDLRNLVVLGDDVPGGAVAWTVFLAAGVPAAPCCAPDDILLIQYTSGTTASPKGVLLRHRSLLGNGFVSGGRMGLRVADRFHSARPFFHVAGTSLSILACVQHAATLVTMERFEPSEALAQMERERCTHFSGNDTMALMLLNHPDRPTRRLALRGAWAAASPSIVRRIIDEMGARECVVGYGLSEASPNVAQSCWWEPDDVRAAGRMAPQPGVEVRVTDGDGADAPSGCIGEIRVRGYTVMAGYYDKPAETAAALDAGGWLLTGDLGRLGTDGRLEFAGRAKDLIRVGGENVAPAEIEDILHRHPVIRQVVVVGVPDPRLMEVACAFIVLNDGVLNEGVLNGEVLKDGQEAGGIADAILAWSRDNMAGYKVPRHIRIVDGFERIGMTASSKIQRRQLRDHAVALLGLA